MVYIASPGIKSGARLLDRIIAVTIGVFAAFYYLWLMDGWGFPGPISHMGDFAYNYLFLSLLDGHLYVPVRTIGHEGHYDAEGRAFMYHGIAPLVVRLLAYPFVDLKSTPLGSYTVGSMAILGSATYSYITIRLLESVSNLSSSLRLTLTAMLSLSVWFVGGGLIVATNSSIYQEPISIAYAMMALFIAVIFRADLSLKGLRPHTLIVLSLIAGVTLHARPHLAIGMYATLVLVVINHLYQHYVLAGGLKKAVAADNRSQVARTIGPALLVLSCFGFLLLFLNAARFGNAFASQGGSTGDSIYGVIYWHVEDIAEFSMAPFEEMGTFNLRRALPNFVEYFGGEAFISVTEILGELFKSGYIMKESPSFGIIGLWITWSAVILCPTYSRRSHLSGTKQQFFALLAAGIGAVLLLSFPAVSFRYRVDLWPVFFVLAAIRLPGIIEWLSAQKEKRRRIVLALCCLFTLYGVALNFQISGKYSELWLPDDSLWSAEKCVLKARSMDFSSEKIARTCRL
ncbi:hypothetical protein [Limibacillus sp. MBR-115]|jgi:drug/metabolite transporter superfamily protein YnfA|uniref:hypothetical protein n=1 Tax=Limibacillus sp. MBR-115 TaxID=3156465 RepID=UPI00339A0D4D